jgi:cellulose synthase/poly-beta-1,6-N-acetylglucosamine synthase-like glycosyltransferase
MAREEQDQRTLVRSAETWRLPEDPGEVAAPLPDGAHRRLSPIQGVVLGLLAAAVAILALIRPGLAMESFHTLFFVGFMVNAGVKLAAACTPRAPSSSLPDLTDESALPAYTIIAPLYREASVAAELIANLSRLDYPRDRLQVLVMLEADDQETQAVFQGLSLPAFFQVIVAPPGSPKTKPRACNIALERARGELIVIYDAEDAPHPGQLREAAARFATEGPDLACLQAPLRIEPDRRFLPDQFALEYAVQFEVFLPALARWGLPFPLGGTSNHFRASALREIGGWDPYNVTEDADVGFRLTARGYRLDVIALPTLETAPLSLRAWRPQRARWVKGHMQTLAVHARGPAARNPRGLLGLVLTLVLSVLSSHLHGPLFLWVAITVAPALLGQPVLLHGPDLVLAVFGWSCVSIAGVRAQQRAGAAPRMLPLIGAVFYWPLQSLAAAQALVQFVVAPFHWDKTPHEPRAMSPTLGRTGRPLP